MLAITNPPSASLSLEHLATELSGALGIPFRADGQGMVFDRPLRMTDWSVPLIFDGHAERRDRDLEPVNFVGHVLWAGLTADSTSPGDRPWWACRLTRFAALAILEDLEYDPYH